MLGRLLGLFRSETTLRTDKAGAPASRELQRAIAVLLLEMAGRDEDYAPSEVEGIFIALEKHFGFQRNDTITLVEEADAARKENPKIDPFVALINDAYNEQQRILLLGIIWRIVMADGSIEKFEQRFATQMQFRLRLSEQQSEQARRIASQRQV